MMYLKSRQDRRVRSGHLWLYSNEIDTKRSPFRDFQPGQLVSLYSASEEFIGLGYFNPNSLISIRLLSRDIQEKIDCGFFINRIRHALALRENLYNTSHYRLVFGESDLLPGLIVDRFGDFFSIQITTLGMESLKNLIIEALIELFQPKGILLKNDSDARRFENLSLENQVVYGELPPFIEFQENNLILTINLLEGQKTGWYFDQQENRLRIRQFVKNKRFLDVFSYTGGFALNALAGGANDVVLIDQSQSALNQAKNNFHLNNFNGEKIKYFQGDSFDLLKELHQKQEFFDVISLDPPALIKKRNDFEQGQIAYLRLHQLAIKLLKHPGILITSSCSMHFSLSDLQDVTRRAALKLNRHLRYFHTGFQAPDHPVHPAIIETLYLKTLFCYLD